MFYKTFSLVFMVFATFTKVVRAEELALWKTDDARFHHEYKQVLNDRQSLPSWTKIFPGTKWCGAGNIAKDYNDLGTYEKTDMCCRDHDFCTDIILAGQTKYGLKNEASYTRLNCDCDIQFRNCLINADSTSANTVGLIFFSVLGTKCYRYEYPVKGCKKYSSIFSSKCAVYDVDTNKPKIYQWFDVPNYY